MELYFEAAKVFATERHDGQTRKDGLTPYITHPVRVAARLQEAGVTKAEILAAAVLHDVLEDTPTKPDELFARFGPRVAALVEEVSRPPGMRRSDFVERVAFGSEGAVLIRVADRLDNLVDATGLDANFRAIYAEEALRLASSALANPRLDRLFASERQALNHLLGQLIDAAREELQGAPKRRRRDVNVLLESLESQLRLSGPLEGA